MSIATATDDRELFGPLAADDNATKRTITEGTDVFHLHRRNGVWVGNPVGTWNATERAAGKWASKDHRRGTIQWVRRYEALVDLALAPGDPPEAEAVAVRDIQAEMMADRRRYARARELAADLNRGHRTDVAASVSVDAVGAAAGGVPS